MIENIFFTIFLDGGDLPPELPRSFDENAASFAKIYPGVPQKIVSLNEARRFVAENFDASVVETLDLLTPYSFKSDLVRYCLLWVYGGIYADVSIRALRPLAIAPATEMVIFQDATLAGCSWSVSGAFIYSKPRRPELMQTIEAIVANAKRRYYGLNSLCPTGPVVIGRSIASCGHMEYYAVGRLTLLTPGERNNNAGYVLNGELVALLFKEKGGDIEHLGFAGSNNYNGLWRARRVYGEIDSEWRHPSPELCCAGAVRRADGLHFSPDVLGNQTFGPYITLEAGKYRTQLVFGEEGLSGSIAIDVACNGGGALLYRHTFQAADLVNNAISIEFAVETYAENLEIRTYNANRLEGRLMRLVLSKQS